MVCMCDLGQRTSSLDPHWAASAWKGRGQEGTFVWLGSSAVKKVLEREPNVLCSDFACGRPEFKLQHHKVPLSTSGSSSLKCYWVRLKNKKICLWALDLACVSLYQRLCVSDTSVSLVSMTQ